MHLTYTSLADGTHLPIWCGRRDKFRNISNACRHVQGMHARILQCVINCVSSKQTQFDPRKKLLLIKRCRFDRVRQRGQKKKKAVQSEERECKRAKCCSLLTLCYYWQTVSQICSLEPPLYRALAAVG